MAQSSLSRRQFLHMSGAAFSALALAACVPAAPSAPAEGESDDSAGAISEDTPSGYSR